MVAIISITIRESIGRTRAASPVESSLAEDLTIRTSIIPLSTKLIAVKNFMEIIFGDVVFNQSMPNTQPIMTSNPDSITT
ncbi:MAG TPA: hypothetical protein DEA62_00675 [Coxiellaceae bacterium]|nr:hypothetical protein [Coxiellaceae bacterium]HBS51500.1 hypothetical protein [Coxiellaceae bacterium]